MSSCKSFPAQSNPNPHPQFSNFFWDEKKSEIEDCTQDWTFPPNSFDYIHMRWLVGSIDDWDRLFQRAYDCTKPGGWLESYEMSTMWESDDGSVTDKSALGQWGKIFIEGGRKAGRTFTVVVDELQRKAMENAGFVDIQERNIRVSTYLDYLHGKGGRCAQREIK